MKENTKVMESRQAVVAAKQEENAAIFEAAAKAISRKDTATYYELMHGMIVRKAVKRMIAEGYKDMRLNLNVSDNIAEDVHQQGYMILWELLAAFKPVKAKGWYINGDTTIDIEVTFENWYEFASPVKGIDRPEQLLYGVLAKRVYDGIRAYVNNLNKVNSMCVLEDLVAGDSVEDVETKLMDTLADKAAELNMGVPETVESLKHVLSKGEYNSLVKWVKEGTSRNIAGKHTTAIKEKILKGCIDAEELYAALPSLAAHDGQLKHYDLSAGKGTLESMETLAKAVLLEKAEYDAKMKVGRIIRKLAAAR